MTLPDQFIRGIPNKDCISEDGYPSTNLFTFQVRANAPEREDCCIEESINWYDEEAALIMILEQEKEPGVIKYKEGAAIINRSEIDHLRSINLRFKENLFYERKQEPGNDYHGNLLLKNNVPKRIKTMITATIANCVHRIERNGNPG